MPRRPWGKKDDSAGAETGNESDGRDHGGAADPGFGPRDAGLQGGAGPAAAGAATIPPPGVATLPGREPPAEKAVPGAGHDPGPGDAGRSGDPGADPDSGRPRGADGPRQREQIPVAALDPPPPPGPAGGQQAVRRLPPPAVLVGNPRLGSDPGALPGTFGKAPDSVLDGARFSHLVVRGASLRGDDHRHGGETRQDSFGLWALPPGTQEGGQPVLLACVADGVGSQPLSHLGSARACELLREQVAAQPALLTGRADPARACQLVIDGVAAGLRGLAAEHRLEPKQVSTTLTAALVQPLPADRSGPAAWVVLFGVGDSCGYVLREGKWLPLADSAAAAAEGTIISTGTNALPTRPDTMRMTTRPLYAGDMLMLCTDGMAGPLASNSSVSDQLAQWWGGPPPSLPDFYWQMSFRAQTYGDDRTAVCVWLDADG